MATYNVHLTVFGFEKKAPIFRPVTKPLILSRRPFNYLNFLVFDEAGNEVHRDVQPKHHFFNGEIEGVKEQLSGNLEVALQEGKYRFFLIGSTKPVGINTHYDLTPFELQYEVLPYSEAYFSYSYGLDPWAIGDNDIFYKEMEILVTKDLIATVLLPRITGELRLRILDPIPSEAKEIGVTIWGANVDRRLAHPYESSTSPSYDADGADTNSRMSRFKSVNLPDQPSTEFTLSLLHLNTELPFNCYVTCYDTNHQLIAEKKINTVQCFANKKTTISGKLFSATDVFVSELPV